MSTGDGAVEDGAVRCCDRKWGDRFLMGTEWQGMVFITTGDDAEENDTVYLYW